MRTGAYILFTVVACLMIGLSIGWADNSPIKVGVVLPLTGEQAKFGEIEKNSLLMGLDEIYKAASWWIKVPGRCSWPTVQKFHTRL